MFEGDRHTKWRGCQYTESGDTLIVGKGGNMGAARWTFAGSFILSYSPPSCSARPALSLNERLT